jgi:bifunctional non-homologous end joining protein LigD
VIQASRQPRARRSTRPGQHVGVLPMLAVPAERVGGLPLDGSAWAYEVKWDGMRVLADVQDGRVRLWSRRGNDTTVAFPELAGLASAHLDVLLDGEVVVLRSGVPSFSALAERFHVRDARRAAVLASAAPATLIAFDVLRLYGVDLTARPWQERREALERLGPSGTAWQLSPVYDDGPALLDATREQGLEGVVAKRRTSPYREGARTGDWVKLAHQRVESCVVGGWRSETDDAGRVGALLLGLWSEGPGKRVLRYAGKAGSGLATADQRDLLGLLASVSTRRSPFDPPVPRPDNLGAHWLDPRLVVQVRHLGHTDGGRLRQPVVLGVRPDLDAADLVGN